MGFSHVFTCSHVFSHVFTCFHMFSHVFTCFHMFSHVFTCFHMFSHVFTVFEIWENYSELMGWFRGYWLVGDVALSREIYPKVSYDSWDDPPNIPITVIVLWVTIQLSLGELHCFKEPFTRKSRVFTPKIIWTVFPAIFFQSGNPPKNPLALSRVNLAPGPCTLHHPLLHLPWDTRSLGSPGKWRVICHT